MWLGFTSKQINRGAVVYRFSQAYIFFWVGGGGWYLLISENAVVQVVKLKKERKKKLRPIWEWNSGLQVWRPLCHANYGYKLELILPLISFLLTRCQLTWTRWCFSWENVFGLLQKLWWWTENTRKHCYAIFGVGTTAKCSVRTQAIRQPSSRQNTTKMKSWKANFVTWTFHLAPKRQMSILSNFFFPFIDIWYFFSSLNLRHCQTIVLLNKLSF